MHDRMPRYGLCRCKCNLWPLILSALAALSHDLAFGKGGEFTTFLLSPSACRVA